MKTPLPKIQSALSATSRLRPHLTNEKTWDTSRTCDAVILCFSSSLGHAESSLTVISGPLSVQHCYTAKPLFHLRFHGFRENYYE